LSSSEYVIPQALIALVLNVLRKHAKTQQTNQNPMGLIWCFLFVYWFYGVLVGLL